jgi:ketosteroid isomerase-like protein
MQALVDPHLEATLDRYYAAIASRDLEDWLGTLSKDVTLHEPASAPAADGHEGAKETWKVLTAAFSKLRYDVQARYFSGSGAAVAWQCNATGVNGAHASGGGITVFEFAADGLIQTVVSYWDPAALLIALATDGDPGS